MSEADYIIDNAIFDIEDYIGGNIENQESIDRMGLTVFLRRTLEKLVAEGVIQDERN